MPKIRELYELLGDPRASEAGEDTKLLPVAKNIVSVLPDAPEDPKEAAAYAIDILKRLIKSKATLVVAFRTMSRPGREKAALRGLLKRT